MLAVAVRTVRLAALAWVVALCPLQRIDAASVPPAPPAEAFGQLPVITVASLSPNGKLFARDRVSATEMKLEIWDIDAGKLVRTLGIDPTNQVRDLTWSDDQTVLMELGAVIDLNCRPPGECRYDFVETRAVDVSGGDSRPLLASGRRQWSSVTRVAAARTQRPHTVMMESLDVSYMPRSGVLRPTRSAERDAARLPRAIYAVDTRSGAEALVVRGSPDTFDWIFDTRGEPVARADWQSSSRQLSIFVRDGTAWRSIFESHDDSVTPMGLTMDGKDVVVVGRNGSDRSKAWALPLDGSPARVLYDEPSGEAIGACIDAGTHAVTCIQLRRGIADPTVRWFDDTEAAQARSLTSAFPGRRADSIEHSVDGRRALVIVDSASTPREWRLVDFDRSRADVIGEAYPDLARKSLGKVSAITYQSRDGKTIPALLTLPPGKEGRDLALVVLPHDGDSADEHDLFDQYAQFLATRGYAVLQPNYRGSWGYGDAHREAGRQQWGGIPQHDITDGVRHLVADGTANPQRVCIVGIGYGGYSALWGAAFAPDVYACAASIGGYSDLPAFLALVRRGAGPDTDLVDWWVDKIGQPDDPKLADWSPARHAVNIKVPVLLLHGSADLVVPISQSEGMERALKDAGKPVRFVSLPDGDHAISRADTRIQVLKELEVFLAKYLQ